MKGNDGEKKKLNQEEKKKKFLRKVILSGRGVKNNLYFPRFHPGKIPKSTWNSKFWSFSYQ
jgi:hypothetical protein